VETIALAVHHHSPALLIPYQLKLNPKCRLCYHRIPMPISKVSLDSIQAAQPIFHVVRKYL